MNKKLILSALGASIAMAAIAADQPTFPGGAQAMDEFIESNIEYPARAMDNGIEGVVHVGFIVRTDGSLADIKVLRPLDPDLEREAVRVVKSMPAWTPSEKDGKPVEAPAQVAVMFCLP